MPHASLDSATSVHYECFGPDADTAGPDLVLVHGTGGSASTNWAHLVEPLAAGTGRRVLAVNYSGSGETTDDGAPLELSRLAAQVRAAIDHAGSRPFDLVGFSLGAVVAAHLAAHDAGDLRKLVLLSGWVRSDPRAALQFGLWKHLHAADRRALAEFLALTGFSPTYLAARPTKAIEQAIRNTLATLAPGFERQCELDTRIDLTADLPLIACPTLVLGATDDQMVPIAGARALAAAIAGAQFGALSAGHLSIYEAPDELVAAIRAFVAD